MRRLRRVARLAWAAPASLLGLLVAPFFARRYTAAGVLVCEGATWPRRLGFRHRAITLGHVVLCIDRVDEALLRHELVHVRQFERLGALLIPAYGLASLSAWWSGLDAYWDNVFEREARGITSAS